ncbi:MAG: Na+/H+ antiporter subunit C [Verrucomicrobiota bacterium]
METLLAFIIGIIMAAGIYCLLRRSIVRLAIGIILISQAANLIIFSSAGLDRGKPPIISAEETALETAYADPLPQALVLTAIVIGFGFISFVLALIYRTNALLGHDDINNFNQTDKAS